MARYAIYYLPQEASDLARFGASVLGYDAVSGLDVPYPDHSLFADPAALGWTAAPRRYGFHATLKAPFRLAADQSLETLTQRLATFAAERRPLEIGLKLARLGEFLALVPSEPSAELRRLADDCVRDFDAFRAPLSPADHERRHPDRLSDSERDNLDRWGYPYVFDEFRFHMTLTGALDGADLVRLEPVLCDLFGAIVPATTIDAVALVHQGDEQGRFVLAARFPLSAT